MNRQKVLRQKSIQPTISGILQRTRDRVSAEQAGVPAAVHDVLRSPGRPLDSDTRAFMEPRFGRDFSGVRVHTDATAADSARAVNALAYTVGGNIVFGAGQYAPQAPRGQRLLAHELTHVIQQRTASDPEAWSPGVQRQYEREARQAGEAIGWKRPELESTPSAPITGGQTGRFPIQRFGSEEHRSLGDEATGGSLVNIGSEDAAGRFELSHGDVIALSGDYFEPDVLMALAKIPGAQGTRIGSRDEIIWALRVIDSEGSKKDPRFQKNGKWAQFIFSEGVKDAMTKRYQRLAAANTGHFVAPRGRDASGQPNPPMGSKGSAGGNYRSLHETAIKTAYQAGRNGGTVSHALAWEAAAQHFLTDSFAAGHLRTPIGLIRDYWGSKYPLFWYNLRHKIALDTAVQFYAIHTNLTTIVGTVKDIYEAISEQVEAFAKDLPPISLGDLLAKIFHDFDNKMGLAVGGGQVFGDSHLDDKDPKNITRKIAVAAIRAGNNDITEAFKVGQSGVNYQGTALYDQVRAATGAPADKYAAETSIPQQSAGNPEQNWKAPSFEDLWGKPIVGTRGPTIGNEITLDLQPKGEIRMQLEDLAAKFPEVENRWSGDVKPRQGYLQGFVAPFVAKPKEGILSIIHWAPNYGLQSLSRDDVSLATGQELKQKNQLGGMTTSARASYVRELIDGYVGSSEEELVVQIFETAQARERPKLYFLVEGHEWTGNWIEGILTADDDLWNALNSSRLNRLRGLINQGWNGRR